MHASGNEHIYELNDLLGNELAAVHSYAIVLSELQNSSLKSALQSNHQSHLLRVSKLTSAVQQLDGSPTEDCGFDGAFEAMILKNAEADDTLACLALTESERLLKYERICPQLSELVRQLVVADLLPEQRKSCNSVSDLIKRVQLQREQ